jgi:hypothetical protein
MRCAKNLINSITPPMKDRINPQIFSVLGVNTHIGTTSNEKEISHGRVLWQARRIAFRNGAVGFIVWLGGPWRILLMRS